MQTMPLACAALVLAFLFSGASSASRRALVIGNGAYAQGALKNAVPDAKAMAERLRGLGFEVTLLLDGTLRALQSGVAHYAESLRGGDESFVFYAGHGVQIKGENFLLPTDFAAETETDAEFAAYRIDQLVGNLEERRPEVSVVVLDACRDNPFHATRSASRGLRMVASGAGSVIAFATSPGKLAMDAGAEGHSVFTASLLSHLGDQAEIEDVLRSVRQEVAGKTGQAQIPWTSAGLARPYYLAGKPSAPAVVASVAAPPAQQSAAAEQRAAVALALVGIEEKLETQKSHTLPLAAADIDAEIAAAVARQRPDLRTIGPTTVRALLQANGQGEGICEVEQARWAGGDWVISGAVHRVFTKYFVDLKLHNVRTTALVAGERAEGRAMQDLAPEIAGAVGRLLGNVK